MIRRLRSIRLTWPQLAIVAAASALATGVIIHVLGSTPTVPYTTLAALRQRVAVRRLPSTPGATAVSPPPGTAPAAAVPAAPAPAPGVADATPAAATSSAPAVSGATPTDTTSTDTTPPGNQSSGAGSGPSPASSIHPVAHVFVIALTTPSYRAAFGPGSPAHYLNATLRRRGTLLSHYRTLGGSELPDYLAMVSGQAPNRDTRSDCSVYAEFATNAKPLTNGQVPGAGCVYPNTTLTIADQVTAAGKQWKAYLADMGTSTCMHPNSGAAADGPLAGVGTQYDVIHNPFIYFHSLLDLGGCSSNDVGLQHLAGDLRAAERTPTYAFIAPGLCDEAVPASCPAGQTGLAKEDAFLRRWVPAITASAAYRQHGVLMIVFARAPAKAGSGPVRTGALILSPDAKGGRTLAGAYDPYSVLRSTEDLLGYTPLVHAKGAKSFAATALTGAG